MILEKEMLRRHFSQRTIETYKFCLEKFLNQVNKPIKEITKKDIRLFLENQQEQGKSGNTLNLYLNALKFYFNNLGKKFNINLRYSKKSRTLPIVLSQEEIMNLINNIKNQKHKLMISLLYSAGLRASELLNLKIKELNLENNYGFIRKGKDNKDRIFIIAQSLKPIIKQLITEENLENEDYLFNNNRNHQYSIRSLQEIIKIAAKAARINKKVHPHTLRHSFATHLIEQGRSLTDVQSLLGHKSPETSMIYVHLASPKLLGIKSPLDTILEQENQQKTSKTISMTTEKQPPQPV